MRASLLVLTLVAAAIRDAPHAGSAPEAPAALVRRCVAAYGGKDALARSAVTRQEGRVTLILQAARLDLPALLSAWVERIEDHGTAELDGRTVRVVAIEPAPGLVVEALIDPASARILRSRGTSRDGAMPLEFATTYEDFRAVEGVLVAFREKNWANGRSTGETVLEKVEFPKALPPELFRP